MKNKNHVFSANQGSAQVLDGSEGVIMVANHEGVKVGDLEKNVESRSRTSRQTLLKEVVREADDLTLGRVRCVAHVH